MTTTKTLQDVDLIDLIERLNIHLVRRPGSGGGWEWVAYTNRATAVSTDLRQAVVDCAAQSAQ